MRGWKHRYSRRKCPDSHRRRGAHKVGSGTRAMMSPSPIAALFAAMGVRRTKPDKTKGRRMAKAKERRRNQRRQARGR